MNKDMFWCLKYRVMCLIRLDGRVKRIFYLFLELKSPKIKLSVQIIAVVQKRGITPLISIGEKISTTIQTRNIFMIKLNRLKVKILKGSKIVFKIGLIKKFAKPRNPPVIKIIFRGPLYSIPWIKFIVWLWLSLIAKKSPNIPAIILNSNFLIVKKNCCILSLVYQGFKFRSTSRYISTLPHYYNIIYFRIHFSIFTE